MQENERPATIKVRLLDLRNQAFLAWYRIRTHLWYAHVFESGRDLFYSGASTSSVAIGPGSRAIRTRSICPAARLLPTSQIRV
jgi:hypothetical protein